MTQAGDAAGEHARQDGTGRHRAQRRAPRRLRGWYRSQPPPGTRMRCGCRGQQRAPNPANDQSVDDTIRIGTGSAAFRRPPAKPEGARERPPRRRGARRPARGGRRPPPAGLPRGDPAGRRPRADGSRPRRGDGARAHAGRARQQPRRHARDRARAARQPRPGVRLRPAHRAPRPDQCPRGSRRRRVAPVAAAPHPAARGHRGRVGGHRPRLGHGDGRLPRPDGGGDRRTTLLPTGSSSTMPSAPGRRSTRRSSGSANR